MGNNQEVKLENLFTVQLMKSPFVKTVKYDETRNFIYHSLFGRHQIVNEPAIRILNEFADPKKLNDWSQETRNLLLPIINKFIDSNLLIEASNDEREILSNTLFARLTDANKISSIRNLGLILTSRCNFRCSYCMMHNMKSASGSPTKSLNMSKEIAISSLKCFVEMIERNRGNVFSVYFAGGEPLLNYNVMRSVVDYCKVNYSNKLKFEFSTNTNASLVTRQIAEWFGQNSFDVTTSLDGTSETNDSIRKLVSGKGTYNLIMKGMELLNRYTSKSPGFYTTLCDENFNAINEEFIDFCIDSLGVKTINIEPDLLNVLNVGSDAVVQRMLDLYRHAGKRGIILSSFLFRPFENIFDDLLSMEKLAWCMSAAGTNVNVDPLGNIVRCVYSEQRFGKYYDLESVLESPDWSAAVHRNLYGCIKECENCDIEGPCLGGCMVTNEYAKYNNNYACVAFRCDLYRKMTKALIDDWLSELPD